MADGAALLRLAEIDERLRKQRGELAAVDAKIGDDSEIQGLRSAAERERAAAQAADAQVQAAEKEFDELRRRAKALEQRLFDGSVTGPAELLTMQKELDVLKSKVGEKEAGLFELMQEAESLNGVRERAALELDEAQGTRSDSLPGLDAQRATLRQAVAEATAEREAAATGIDVRAMALYERVLAKHHPAVVHLDGERCGGCHLPLAPHEIHEVRTGGALVQCSNCDRILVP